jgi:hypothetical protein
MLLDPYPLRTFSSGVFSSSRLFFRLPPLRILSLFLLRSGVYTRLAIREFAAAILIALCFGLPASVEAAGGGADLIIPITSVTGFLLTGFYSGESTSCCGSRELLLLGLKVVYLTSRQLS